MPDKESLVSAIFAHVHTGSSAVVLTDAETVRKRCAIIGERRIQ